MKRLFIVVLTLGLSSAAFANDIALELEQLNEKKLDNQFEANRQEELMSQDQFGKQEVRRIEAETIRAEKKSENLKAKNDSLEQQIREHNERIQNAQSKLSDLTQFAEKQSLALANNKMAVAKLEAQLLALKNRRTEIQNKNLALQKDTVRVQQIKNELIQKQLIAKKQLEQTLAHRQQLVQSHNKVVTQVQNLQFKKTAKRTEFQKRM